MKNINEIKSQLEEYFKKRNDILMAFLFGSYTKGNFTSESDLDVAVYFRPETRTVE